MHSHPYLRRLGILFLSFTLFGVNARSQMTEQQENVLMQDSDGDGFLDGPDVWKDGKLYLSEFCFGWRGFRVRELPYQSSSTSRDYSWTNIYDKNEYPTTLNIHVDTDADGLPDIDEDANKNGIFEPELGETDFRDADTDDDGVSDAYERGFCPLDTHFLNSKNNRYETNPLDPDTDHDGLPDGLELGITDPWDGVRRWLAHIPAVPVVDTDLNARFKFEKKVNGQLIIEERPCFIADADPESITDPTIRDTNGDGLPDGEQDINANGKCDPGETSASAGFVTDELYYDAASLFKGIRPYWDVSDFDELTYQTPSGEENPLQSLKLSHPQIMHLKAVPIYPDRRYWGCVFVYSAEEEIQQDFPMYSIPMYPIHTGFIQHGQGGCWISSAHPDENLSRLIALWEKNQLVQHSPKRSLWKIFLRFKEETAELMRLYGESPEFVNGKTPDIVTSINASE